MSQRRRGWRDVRFGRDDLLGWLSRRHRFLSRLGNVKCRR
jgi:hypothetical protein